MERYLIKSQNTEYFLTTQEAKPGHVVVTANGKDTIPPQAVLTVKPHLRPGPNVVTISAHDGLYVALPEGAGDDAKLIWSDNPYRWVVTQTATGPYEVRPAEGHNPDLYWFDKFGIGPVIIVKPGREVQPPQAYFSFLPILRD